MPHLSLQPGAEVSADWREGFKNIARKWVPPGLIELIGSALDHVRPAQWEYVPEGWQTTLRLRGWNIDKIVEAHKRNWERYVQYLSSSGPLWLNHEDLCNPISMQLRDHNTLVSYAYVLALASCQQRFSLLDWGGGLGFYYLLTKAIVPDAPVDYCCYDLPVFCKAGRELLPDVRFVEDREECFAGCYDLVLASSSLWYEQDWRALLARLARVANAYLFVTRMVFLDNGVSYVAVQRPWKLGYRTEYLCWILNRQEFLDEACAQGLRLVREFFVANAPHIHRAPVQGAIMGFLFSKTAR